MIGTARGAVLEGIEATTVTVEADVSPGIPHFHIVGLPDSAVSESKLRIRSAIRNTGLQFPSHRITVNLSPASMRKRGPGLDLAIAIAILRASGQLPGDPADHPRGPDGHRLAIDSTLKLGFCAELGLSGQLVPVGGLVNLAIALRNSGTRQVCISERQTDHCAPLPDIAWHGFYDLQGVVRVLCHQAPWPAKVQHTGSLFGRKGEGGAGDESVTLDMADVQGLEAAKRALTVAAVGGFHVLLVGPPGCGKTMIAERFCSILPPLTDEAALEVYAIAQAVGLPGTASTVPPLRSPHHSVTAAGLIGGGLPPMPGEATLAHRGVLLLDEMPEFERHALNALREPLVNRQVRLARGGKTVHLPADFLLVGTMNPCPCGARGFGECRCSEGEVQRYWSRLSGPLLDRIDLLVHVHPQDWAPNAVRSESSASIQSRVLRARHLLSETATLHGGHGRPMSSNADSDAIAPDASGMIAQAARLLHLSQRAATSVRQAATAIAAIAGRCDVQEVDVQEALSLRALPLPGSSMRS